MIAILSQGLAEHCGHSSVPGLRLKHCFGACILKVENTSSFYFIYELPAETMYHQSLSSS
jgi:hypothetical protein